VDGGLPSPHHDADEKAKFFRRQKFCLFAKKRTKKPILVMKRILVQKYFTLTPALVQLY
jgi:hypothetical protein